MSKLFSSRKLLENVGLFLVALFLAVIVWFIAVGEENPLEQRVFPRLFLARIVGIPADMFLVEDVNAEVTLTLLAARSVWMGLTSNQLSVSVDVSGLEPGEHIVPITATVADENAEIVVVAPSEVRVVLERIITRSIPITLDITGEPATGYEAQIPVLSSEAVEVTGPAPQVNAVASFDVKINLDGERETIARTFSLRATDSNGQTVLGLTLEPNTVQVDVELEQLESFRDVAVRAIIEGEVAPGYRVTNVAITPSVVTVFSSQLELIVALPGFVETVILDIADASDDEEARLTVQLPEGVSLVGEQSVLVQVNIAAIESSLSIQHELEFTGLEPGLKAVPSPEMVELILFGPLPILDELEDQDVTVLLDVLGLDIGTYQLSPSVIVGPQDISVEGILPDIVQVEIEIDDSTPTPTQDPNATPTTTLTPTATATATVAVPTATPTSE